MRLQDPTRDSSTRNLKRLFMLRNLVIVGELLALLVANTLVELDLPVQPLLFVISLQALLNIWTWRRILGASSIQDGEFFIQLAVDVLALTGVLYFTGGATNPFAWFFLLPLIITATVLSATATWLMAVLTTACYTLLMFFFIPLAGNDHMQHNANFAQHVFGMWFGFVLSAALIAWFVVGMANTLRERDRLLAEVRERTLRDEQLVAMGTLATGAAHELGTPLATMAILTKELERADVSDAMQRKLDIMRDQITRCKQALSVISASAGEVPAESGFLVQVEHFIEKLSTEWQQLHPDTLLDVQLQPGAAPAHIVAEHTLHQALINLLNNAVEASSQTLVLKADWDQQQLVIEILDRGPGLHPQTVGTIDQRKTSHKEYGMGLGLFLTHATLQRLGGNIELFDREGGGTCTRVTLPLATFSLP